MKLLFVLLLTVGSLVSDARLLKRQATTDCTNPTIRKEWRSLTNTEKSSYIEAVKCLATQPSRMNSASSLYDDFASVHRILDTKSRFYLYSTIPVHLKQKIEPNFDTHNSSSSCFLSPLAPLLRSLLRGGPPRTLWLHRIRNLLGLVS